MISEEMKIIYSMILSIFFGIITAIIIDNLVDNNNTMTITI